MSEERFHLLQTFLRFANNKNFENDSPNQSLFKIQQILDHPTKKLC